MDYQIRQANERITGLEAESAGLKVGLKDEIEKTGQAMQAMGQAMGQALAPLRGSQAEGRAELTEIRKQIQQLQGGLDTLKRDLANTNTLATTLATTLTTTSNRAARLEEENKILREKIDNLTFRVTFLENFFEIGKQGAGGAAVAKSGTAVPNSSAAKTKTETDKESLYVAAYELFKDGKYTRSREAFEVFLKQYPSSEFSDNAQFWIAECYYFDKQYEKAIIEYDKTIKNFPEGNRVPNAVLKQGLSFLALGDKTSARLLLQQVIQDYPNTSQARIANQNLLQIK